MASPSPTHRYSQQVEARCQMRAVYLIHQGAARGQCAGHRQAVRQRARFGNKDAIVVSGGCNRYVRVCDLRRARASTCCAAIP
jgi:hypothetical protein